MKRYMDKEQFRYQLDAAVAIPEAEALQRQDIRISLGQKALIRFLPVGENVNMQSFWTDICGKARQTDGIAPYFTETGVRGIALWRNPPES